MQRKTTVALLAVILATAGVAGGYAFFTYYSTPGSNSCPDLFASVTYSSATGFTTVAHPQSGTTEYVLPPNATGHLEITFSSPDGNLTKSMFTDPVPVWFINTSTNAIHSTTDVTVTTLSIDSQSTHTIVVNYTVAAGSTQSLYLLGFPSTCHSALLNVGTSAYLGPLPW
jgi:hypothetical protein